MAEGKTDVIPPGDPLGRFHRPDGTAFWRGLAETGTIESKGKYRGFFADLEPDYEGGGRWGGGKHVWQEWLTNPDSVDLEFRGLFNGFLMEKYGVGGLEELREIVEAGKSEFKALEGLCDRLLESSRLTNQERGLLDDQITNLHLLRRMSPSQADLSLDGDLLFDRFLNWLSKESSPSAQLVEETNKKFVEFAQEEGQKKARRSPKSPRSFPKRPQSKIEKKEPQKVKVEEQVKPAAVQAPPEKSVVTPAVEEEKPPEPPKPFVGKVLLTVPVDEKPPRRFVRPETEVKPVAKESVPPPPAEKKVKEEPAEPATEVPARVEQEKSVMTIEWKTALLEENERAVVTKFFDLLNQSPDDERYRFYINFSPDQPEKVSRICVGYFSGQASEKPVFVFIPWELLLKGTVKDGFALKQEMTPKELLKNWLRNRGLKFAVDFDPSPTFPHPESKIEIRPLNPPKKT